MDVEEVRQCCCVVVTHGKDGCGFYWKDEEMKIGPFGANWIDPTGAGDCFLGGLVLGLVVPAAALLGNFFDSLTVAQIGLPKFDLRLLQRVKDEVQPRKLHCTICFDRRDDELSFSKPPGRKKFHASLASTKLVSTCSIQECQCNLTRSSRKEYQVIRAQYIGQPKLLLNYVFDEPT